VFNPVQIVWVVNDAFINSIVKISSYTKDLPEPQPLLRDPQMCLYQQFSSDQEGTWEQISHPIYCACILSVKQSWSTQIGCPCDETRQWGPARHLLYINHWTFCVGPKLELVWSKILKMCTGWPSAPLHPLFRSTDPLQSHCATC